MKIYLSVLSLCIIILSASCAVSHNPQRKTIRNLQSGKTSEDSSFVYTLPYETKERHLLAQGYFSRFSHKERAALDFKMKRGTPVMAARSGKVIRVKQDGDRGGWNKKYRPYGNVIVIDHGDGTRAGYWHLQQNSIPLKLGDSVLQNQLIGLSGKTGYALFPHLHFIVWGYDSLGKWKPVPTRFKTKSGIQYLKPMHSYRKPGDL